MRRLRDLLSDDSAWPLVKRWAAEAGRDIKVLSGDRAAGEATLLRLQVTTHSPLGAIGLETAGIIVDHGWLRIMGHGGDSFEGLVSWNWEGPAVGDDGLDDALIIAHDAVGGFFALDGGGLGEGLGEAFYFAPDTLRWQSLGFGYTDFVGWAFTGDLGRFYADLRWLRWEREVERLSPNEGVSFYPPLWSKESKPLENARRAAVPMRELWTFHRDSARKLADLPEGSPIRIVSPDQ